MLKYSNAIKFPNPTHVRKSNRMFKRSLLHKNERSRNDFSSLDDRSTHTFAAFVITRIHRGNCILHVIVSSFKEDHAECQFASGMPRLFIRVPSCLQRLAHLSRDLRETRGRQVSCPALHQPLTSLTSR